MRWAAVREPDDPCPACEGSGSQWKKRSDGKVDRRYFFPIGPCPRCDGTGSRSEEASQSFADRMAAAVRNGRVSLREASSVLGMVALDAAGHADLVPRWTRERNVARMRRALGQESRVERAA